MHAGQTRCSRRTGKPPVTRLQPNTIIRPSPVLKHTRTTSELHLWQMVCFTDATTVTGSPDRIILCMPQKKPNTFMFYLKHGISSITPRPLKKLWFPHYVCMRVPTNSFWAFCHLLLTEYVQEGIEISFSLSMYGKAHSTLEQRQNMALQMIFHTTFKARRALQGRIDCHR